jgi:hypothetical protein
MNINRQSIYLLAISVFLLIFVLLFSFMALIPNGKEYRLKKSDLRKEQLKLRQLSDFAYDTSTTLQKLQTQHRHIITAFATPFTIHRFEKQHRNYFTSLSVSKMKKLDNEEDFSVYEVNTTSEITSPKNFYNFLEAVNKSNWIVGVNFPITFKRDGEIISSSFTMKVYENNQELNTTK